MPQLSARPAWGAPVAHALLIATAAAAWSPVLGRQALLLLAPAAIAVPLAARRLAPRAAAGALLVWLAGVPLLAGVRVATPWPEVPGRLLAGAQRLAAAAEPAGGDAWAVAAALTVAGFVWVASALGATARPGAVRCAAFVLAALPWIASVAAGPVDAPAWEGAAVALAGLLWWACGRIAPGRAVALSLAVALVAGAAAHAAGRERRLSLPGLHGEPSPRFRTLSTLPTYASLDDRRDGATMLEIRSPRPALWRMQVLDVFDGSGWRAGAERAPRLAEPAARPVTIHVRVRGLRNEMAVAPGRIDSVETSAAARPTFGGAWRIAPAPGPGDAYRVHARVVDPDRAALARAPAPSQPGLRRYTLVGSASDGPWTAVPGEPMVLALLRAIVRSTRIRSGLPLNPPLFGTGRPAPKPRPGSAYAPVAALARRLAAGARTPFEVVARVQRYLLDEDRFRYTTRVRTPGPYPLADFLLRDRAGYCQHFAGAAALLLRLAGVPARVVVGFGTGSADYGRYRVRDVDAHAWIEVYFEGAGWVPFNPTPSAAPAAVPPDLVSDRAAGPRPWPLAAAAAALAVLLARRRRAEPAAPLVRLARRTGLRVTPATTLGELQAHLARSIGPRTAALAADLERERFAPTPPHGRRVAATARALAADLSARPGPRARSRTRAR